MAMDIFAMLETAMIVDPRTDEVFAQACGFGVLHGRMRVLAIPFDEEEDPEDGTTEEKEPEKEDKVVSLVTTL